jgi:hypothetical protein
MLPSEYTHTPACAPCCPQCPGAPRKMCTAAPWSHRDTAGLCRRRRQAGSAAAAGFQGWAGADQKPYVLAAFATARCASILSYPFAGCSQHHALRSSAPSPEDTAAQWCLHARTGAAPRAQRKCRRPRAGLRLVRMPPPRAAPGWSRARGPRAARAPQIAAGTGPGAGQSGRAGRWSRQGAGCE